MHPCICTSVCAHTHVCMCMLTCCMRACMHACVHACMPVCVQSCSLHTLASLYVRIRACSMHSMVACMLGRMQCTCACAYVCACACVPPVLAACTRVPRCVCACVHACTAARVHGVGIWVGSKNIWRVHGRTRTMMTTSSHSYLPTSRSDEGLAPNPTRSCMCARA